MSVGLARLDDDHKALIAIINRLASAMVEAPSQNSDELERVIQQSMTALIRYTEYHFSREEAVLAAAGYATLDQHKREHKRFIRELQELRVDMASSRSIEKRERLLGFLRDWLTHHIMVEDQAYKDRIHGNPAAARAAEGFSAVDSWTSRVG